MKNLVLVLAMLIGMVGTATAQSRVVDLSGNGIPNVEVVGVSQCQPTAAPIATATLTTFTDADGRFSWPTPGIPPANGSACMLNTTYYYTLKKEGYVFTRNRFDVIPRNLGIFVEPRDERLPLIQGTTVPVITNVSAASFINDQWLTGDMIVAGFGADLAGRTESALLPLPTSLAGRKVLVQDLAGIEKPAKLLFVAPTQINYIVPDGLADGPAVIRLVDEVGNLIRVGLARLRIASPAVFTANADGKGVPAAVIVRVKADGTQNYEPISQYDESQKKFIPLLIDLGPDEEIVVLALFGTGWRHFASQTAFKVLIGGVECPVEYAGKQPTLEGLDQINVRLPRTLISRGEVEGSVSINLQYSSNVIKLNFK